MNKLNAWLRDWIIPLLAVLIFSIISCLNLQLPIWYDEAYSAYIIRGSFSDIWQMTALDVHPPFYYFCLKVWSGIFGSSEFALRSMSVFFVAVGLILAYLLFRRWFGKRTANVAAIFMALSPFLIRYAQEARMYGLVFAIVMGATLTLDVALKSKKKAAWACYALLIALGMWTHYFAALAWIAHFAHIVFYMCKHGLQKDVFWAYPLAVLCFSPWFATAANQFFGIQNGFWISAVSADTLAGIVTQALFLKSPGKTTDWQALLLVAEVCALIALAIRKISSSKADSRKNLGFLCAMVAIPPSALILLSLPPLKPTFVARYVAFSIALAMGLIAYIVCLPNKKNTKTFNRIVLALLICCVGLGVHESLTRTSESQTKDIILRVESVAAAPILFDGDEMDDFDAFFYESKSSPVYEIDIDFKWGALEPIRRYDQNYIGDTGVFLADKDGFWYVVDKGFDKDVAFAGFVAEEEFENDKYLAAYYKKDQ